MRHIDERDADLLLDVLELDLHLLAELQVERAQRLVEQENLGLVDDGPRECDPLALAAGQLVGPAVLEPFEPDHLQCAADALAPARSRNAFDLEPVADVLAHRHVWEERVVLEYGVGLADVWREHGDIAAAQLDAAGVGTFEAGDEPQQRRLARPRRAEQREELAFAHLEVDAVSRDDVPVALADALQAQGQAFPPV